MTEVGSGGVQVSIIIPTKRFKKDFNKLPQNIQNKLEDKFKDLMKDPMPRGLRFEKLQGYSSPSVYSFHIDGNFKVSLELDGDKAKLRRTGSHKAIDRTP